MIFRKQSPDEELISLGAVQLHPKYATQHFLCVGGTGSGKTVLLRRALKSILPSSWFANRGRMVLYDAKQDFLPMLYGLGQGARLKILHPFDRRGAAWRLAEDVVSVADARQFAAVLLPDSKEQSADASFFRNASRELLTAVLVALMNAPHPGVWEFRDVLLAALYPPYTEHLLRYDTRASGEPILLIRRVRKIYLEGEPRLRANVVASLNAALGGFEEIAAAYDVHARAGRWFSLTEWQRGGQILVLPADETCKNQIDALNRWALKRLAELVLAEPEQAPEAAARGEGLTFIVLDELPALGKLDALPPLALRGRSKGVCLLAFFQDFAGPQEIYGNEGARQIVAQFGNQIFLRQGSQASADLAAREFGRFLAQETTQSDGASFNLSPDGTPTLSGQNGSGTGFQERSSLHDSDFLFLPPTNRVNGMHGYHRFVGMDFTKHGVRFHLDWNTRIAPLLPPHSTRPEHAAFLPLSPDCQYLRAWDEADWRRLGFAGSPPPLEPSGPLDDDALGGR